MVILNGRRSPELSAVQTQRIILYVPLHILVNLHHGWIPQNPGNPQITPSIFTVHTSRIFAILGFYPACRHFRIDFLLLDTTKRHASYSRKHRRIVSQYPCRIWHRVLILCRWRIRIALASWYTEYRECPYTMLRYGFEAEAWWWNRRLPCASHRRRRSVVTRMCRGT